MSCIKKTEERIMSFFFHLLALALITSFCVKADHPPAPSCSNSTSHWLSKDLTEDSMNLTVFKLSFLSNHSLSFTFTSEELDDAPRLAFIFILMSPQPAASFDHSMQPSLPSCTKFTLSESLPPHVCNPLPQQIQAAIAPSCSSEPDPYHPGERHFKDELSLKYNAETTTLHVEENFYQDGLKPNKTVEIDLQPDAVDFNENITLFVAYITSGEASINFTTKESTVDTPSSEKLMHPDVNIDHDNAKSNQIKVVVWVIVGVSMMGLLMGLLILVLFIKKRRGQRPSLVLSRPPAGHRVPPSATSRAPFDLESNETPMMRALPLSPPYTQGFQTSATASWLKQPNPR